MDASGAGGAPQTGTTIVAAVFDGGVVLGADTRVTTGARTRNIWPAARALLRLFTLLPREPRLTPLRAHRNVCEQPHV